MPSWKTRDGNFLEGKMSIRFGLAGMTIMLLASGCIESTGYPATSYAGGYSGYDGGYYGQQAYYPAYRVYNPPPTVVTQTRYVPVPAAPQHEVRRAEDRNRDTRKDDRRDDRHADRRDQHDHDNNSDTDRSRH
jgi:hypothetical protein